jgi:starch synthase (maltosyl-transferring)
MHYPALARIIDRLNDRIAARSNSSRAAPPSGYAVPGLWIDPEGPVAARHVVPEQFFIDRLKQILRLPEQPLDSGGEGPGDWGKYAVAYNLFIRAGAAWDHDGDGGIALGPNEEGWRETGTILKAIALLPFIHSLGCNTVHLLPITTIGRDGHKGNLGSPFAIRDPYALDEGLSEPALGLGPDAEFAGFVEAAHHLGLRVVVEFVFRTAAKDSVWAGEHPEWFYWIRADVADRQPDELDEEVFGAPLFTPPELERIYQQVGTGEHVDLLPPHKVYRRMFLPPPAAEDVELVDGHWLGRVADPQTGRTTSARIPGAFCDWTPDSDQPPWSDVTYFRLYDHHDFNYIAYNTVRIYDARLAQAENAVASLWNTIVEVVPHYQAAFGIDGVMIDMGHALPAELKRRLIVRAREMHPDFALWAEDFDLKPSSRAEGYNVCLGPFMQTVRDPAALKRWLDHLHLTGVPVPFMATPENHNTPRAATWPGGRDYATYALTVGALLPSIPYVHGGIELGETLPINTGFDFSQAQLAGLPAEVLPLFSAAAYDWGREPNLVPELRAILALRRRYRHVVVDPSPESIRRIDTSNPSIIAFVRGRPGTEQLLVVCNSDMSNPQAARIVLCEGEREAAGARSNIRAPSAASVTEVALAPAQVIVRELP